MSTVKNNKYVWLIFFFVDKFLQIGFDIEYFRNVSVQILNIKCHIMARLNISHSMLKNFVHFLYAHLHCYLMTLDIFLTTSSRFFIDRSVDVILSEVGMVKLKIVAREGGGGHLYRRLTKVCGGGFRFWALSYGEACARTRPLSTKLSTEDPFLRVRIIYKNNCYFYLIDILILIF